MKDKILGVLKRIFVWGLLPLTFLTFLFVIGEQFEVGRLQATADCEQCPDVGLCLREKGYLPKDPYYPDLTRRFLGAFARSIGGDLGASYQVSKPKSKTPPAAKNNENGDEDIVEATSK